MPPPIPVNLVPYDAERPRLAAVHAVRLLVLEPALVALHHIGSTSVPGLAAKPIFDIMPVVRDLAELDGAREHVEALGYAWHGAYGMPGRRYCTLSDEAGVRLAQLHFFVVGSAHVVRHLAFRDYLRTYPAEASAYEAEKRRVRELYPNDSHAYGIEKSAWIRKTEATAMIWYGRPGPNADRSETFRTAAVPGGRPG